MQGRAPTESMSSYAVKMSREDEHGSAQVESLAEIHDYIREFDHDETVAAQQIFSPFVACNVSTLFGMKRFGGGEDYDEGIQKWKYFAFHGVMMVCFGLGMYVTMYCCGMSALSSAIISVTTWPPLMIVSMIAESKIFKSLFLAAALLRGGDKVEALKKGMQ